MSYTGGGPGGSASGTHRGDTSGGIGGGGSLRDVGTTALWGCGGCLVLVVLATIAFGIFGGILTAAGH